MKQWFASLAQREKIMVVSAAVVVIVFLFYMVLWQPLTNGIGTLNTRVASQRDLVSWLAGVTSQAQRLRGSGNHAQIKGQDQSLLSLVDKTSRSAQLGKAVRHIRPDGQDKATITFDAAGFNKLLFWLHDLQKEYGIDTRALTVTSEDKPGQVQARISLERNST